MAHALFPGNTGEPAVNKEPNLRLIRRNVGLVAGRTGELNLQGIDDPRKGRVKLKMREALTGVLADMAAGCKGLVHDLPLRVASLDGKATSTWLWDDPKPMEKYGQI